MSNLVLDEVTGVFRDRTPLEAIRDGFMGMAPGYEDIGALLGCIFLKIIPLALLILFISEILRRARQ